MDLYPGRQVALGVMQTHDLNPGVAPSGLFWTTPTSDESVSVNPVVGTAAYEVIDLAIPDSIHVANGVANGPNIPARVTFRITWSPGTTPRPFSVSDAENDFGGDFVAGVATAQWSMTEEGFTFTSDPAAGTKSPVAVVGFERNGEFFSP